MGTSDGAFVYVPEFQEHGTGDHVERPARLQAIADAVAASGLLERVDRLEPRPATAAEIERVHPPGYAESLDAFSEAGGGYIDPDTYLSRASARVARLAAGSALRAVEGVVREGYRWAFSACRPPGHHALPDHAMGFCLLNNAAIAARHARAALALDRVLIVDWDVHHGNGSQDIFWTDPSVMYFSVHQFPLYPGTGRLRERGDGAGAGTTLNVPLPAGMGDRDYEYVFDRLLRPAVRDFAPQLVIVSAGFDAHERDPLGKMLITTDGFARLAARVREMAEETPAKGRIVGLLEGGYDLRGLSESVVAVMDRWAGPGRATEHVERGGVARPVLDVERSLLEMKDM